MTNYSGAKILALCGSLRRDSINRKLLKIAVRGAVEAGAEVTELDLGDFPLPIYDGDLETAEGVPENALKLKDAFRDHNALLIATPEYNGGVTPVLKNVVDWVSRPLEDEPGFTLFMGKTVGLISAADGVLGGARAQAAWRATFQVLQCVLSPATVNVPHADKAFDEDGNLKDAMIMKMTMGSGKKLAQIATKQASI